MLLENIDYIFFSISVFSTVCCDMMETRKKEHKLNKKQSKERKL